MRLNRILLVLIGLVLSGAVAMGQRPALRPPAVPLVVSNPNFSIWSCADRLTDDSTRHWTRRMHPLNGLIRIDGKTFRLMGKEPESAEPMSQKSLQVLPTRTIYTFENGQVSVVLTFMTPVLPDDFEVLSRPLTYLTWEVKSVDGAQHAVELFQSVSGLLAVNTPSQQVTWMRENTGDLTALKIGTVDQPILGSAGDDHRIDWGYAYAVGSASKSDAAMASQAACLAAFAKDGSLPENDKQMPRAANQDMPVLAFVFKLGQVQQQAVSRHMMLAYDEIYSIDYFGKKLRPYWRKNGAGPAQLFQAAEDDYAKLADRCAKFDEEMMADLAKAGGDKYAVMCALAYRQALAGCGLAADSYGQPLLFTKENTSNGCIATVDVIYPAAPQFLLMGPSYAKALVAPAMVYSASPRWKFPFAPHDLGTYPLAIGQAYAGGENSTNDADMMPVEESANLILLCDAIAKMEGNAEFASRWWPQITAWEKYLEKYGLDPENQLCTDDFMGHLAHNSNLSIKAILAIAAYGDLARMRGDAAAGDKYLALAREDAKHWIETAADGNHFRIAFDKPNTWSQKYNLVWDKLLGLNVFPPDVAKKEVAWYRKEMQKYGVPLDSRTKLTKTDWSFWSATLADNQQDFEAIVAPTLDYLNQTTAREMFADSYITTDLRRGGMHARPVIGGLFIKMLDKPEIWKKWAARDKMVIGQYATVGPRPEVKEIVPTSRKAPVTWRYTTQRPTADWMKPGFDAGAWKEAAGPFGSAGTPGISPRTDWRSGDIYLRREMTLPPGDYSEAQFVVYHDEDVEIYLNGILAARRSGFTTSYQPLEILPAAQALLKSGATLTISVHCHQTRGGQGIDVGLGDLVGGK